MLQVKKTKTVIPQTFWTVQLMSSVFLLLFVSSGVIYFLRFLMFTLECAYYQQTPSFHFRGNRSCI